MIWFRGLVLFLAVSLCVSAQTTASRPESLPTSTALDAKLEAIRVKHAVPALGAAATSGERLLAISAVGFRKKDAPERVTVDDRWHLGSCTKSMTATMLARVVDRGKLSWDLTLAKAFPDLADRMDPLYRPVTLEQLLAHRAGVPADLSPDRLWARLWERKGTPTDQRHLLLEGVVCRAPASTPGTAYLYSNAGVAIAGHAAERLTGKAYEDLMRDEMFGPLGMASAGFGAPGAAGSLAQPWGHGREGKPVEPGPGADNPPGIAPGGTAHASLADWAKYAAVHLLGAKGRTDYLKPETFVRIQAAPREGEYAFGWSHTKRSWANGHVLTHTGSNTMWFAVVWLAPGRDVAFLAVCNSGVEAAPRATDEAIGAVMAAVKDQLPR